MSAREVQARERLRPLAADERPVTLRVACAAALVLAIAVLAGALSSNDLAKHGGSLAGGVFIALVLGALAVNMWRKRYWAVLGFEALLAFQIVVATLALVVASTLLAAAICIVAIAVGGTLFWKLVSVMGRLQATDRARAASVTRQPASATRPVAPRPSLARPPVTRRKRRPDRVPRRQA